MKPVHKAILEENRNRNHRLPFIMYEEIQPENKWYMTFGRTMPHLRKWAIPIPAWLGLILTRSSSLRGQATKPEKGASDE